MAEVAAGEAAAGMLGAGVERGGLEHAAIMIAATQCEQRLSARAVFAQGLRRFAKAQDGRIEK